MGLAIIKCKGTHYFGYALNDNNDNHTGHRINENCIAESTAGLLKVAALLVH